MKLSEWAKSQGINYQTAFLWFKKGQLLVPAYQTASGTIIVTAAQYAQGQTAAYVRVSSHNQKSDIERQVARITMWGTENGYAIHQVITEIGSGQNGHYEAACRPEVHCDHCGAPGPINEVWFGVCGVSPCRSGQEARSYRPFGA
jgi:putative resolvase